MSSMQHNAFVAKASQTAEPDAGKPLVRVFAGHPVTGAPTAKGGWS